MIPMTIAVIPEEELMATLGAFLGPLGALLLAAGLVTFGVLVVLLVMDRAASVPFRSPRSAPDLSSSIPGPRQDGPLFDLSLTTHRSRVLLSVAVLVMTISPMCGQAGAVSLRDQCRRECRSLLQTCGPHGPRGPRVCFERLGCVRAPSPCRREWKTVLRRCREEGPAYCEIDWGPTVNRCNGAWAEDQRGESDVTVTSVGELAYAPECIRVSVGTRVTFESLRGFDSCPLVGGVPPVPDPSSPFNLPTTGGDSRTFTLSEPGLFPYYCKTFPDLFGTVVVVPN